MKCEIVRYRGDEYYGRIDGMYIGLYGDYSRDRTRLTYSPNEREARRSVEDYLAFLRATGEEVIATYEI